MKCLIVDENDTIIGAKSKDEIDFSKDIYRVSGIWVINSKNEVLIAQRSITNTNGAGLWGPSAAGTVELGETYEENAYKELDEELGITGVTLVREGKIFVKLQRSYFCEYFSVHLDKPIDEFKLQESEVNAVAWVSFEYLESDCKNNPQKYIPSMSRSVQNLKNFINKS
ncbi:MAG: NUDIX domain-containing protein [Candidatus Microsaccharimonas sp.]